MFKQICVWILILAGSSAIHSQDTGLKVTERMEKGNQIIEKSRKEVRANKLISDIDSFQLSIKSVSDLKQSQIVNTKEIYVLLPDKILSIYSTTKPFESKSTNIWNGEKHKELSEFVSPDGQRTVRDVTNSNSISKLGKVVKDPEILEKFKKVMAVDPKEKLNNDLWHLVFPLIITHPFETESEFKYVGKAKSADREANIVDTTSKSGHSIRLLFDSTTSELILMTEKYKGFDGDYENNYYFSNRELMDKILIPKKIKIENKYTPTGGDTKVTYQYIDVLDFKVNPKFKSNLFDVK